MQPPNVLTPLISAIVARPRLSASVLLGIMVVLLTPASILPNAVTRGILAWNLATVLYLALIARMMFGSTHERMRSRAKQQEVGRHVVLGMAVLSAVASLVAIVVQLRLARELPDYEKFFHVGLAALTILTTWLFTQTTFALHYAHDYYIAEDRKLPNGLDFPGHHAPDYGDFLYFSFVIGTSGQTADISFTGRSMRRIGLIHCVLAFFFNTTVLALTINIASGLL